MNGEKLCTNLHGGFIESGRGEEVEMDFHGIIYNNVISGQLVVGSEFLGRDYLFLSWIGRGCLSFGTIVAYYFYEERAGSEERQ